MTDAEIYDCDDYQTTMVFLPRPASAGDLMDAIAVWWRELETRVAAANLADGGAQPCRPSLVAISASDDGEGYSAKITWVV